MRANHSRSCLLRAKVSRDETNTRESHQHYGERCRVARWIRLGWGGQGSEEDSSKRGVTEMMLVSAATSLGLLVSCYSEMEALRKRHAEQNIAGPRPQRPRMHTEDDTSASNDDAVRRFSPRLSTTQSASRRHRFREMHHSTFHRRRREEEYAGCCGEVDQHETSIRRGEPSGSHTPLDVQRKYTPSNSSWYASSR